MKYQELFLLMIIIGLVTLRSNHIENTVMYSKTQGIARLLVRGDTEPTDNSLAEFFAAKSINTTSQQAMIERKIRILFNPNKARKEIFKLQKEPYNKNNEAHEKMIMELWDTMIPEEKLKERISDQWRKIIKYK